MTVWFQAWMKQHPERTRTTILRQWSLSDRISSLSIFFLALNVKCIFFNAASLVNYAPSRTLRTSAANLLGVLNNSPKTIWDLAFCKPTPPRLGFYYFDQFLSFPFLCFFMLWILFLFFISFLFNVILTCFYFHLHSAKHLWIYEPDGTRHPGTGCDKMFALHMFLFWENKQ